MNKTLLLIICDFLLLNLLALTRWDSVEPPDAARAPATEVAAKAARTASEDLAATLRVALEDERAVREQMSVQWRSNMAVRDLAVQGLEEQRRAMETNLSKIQISALELSQKLAGSAQAAAQTQQRLAEAQTRLTEAERARAALTDSLHAAEAERKRLSDSLAGEKTAVQRQQETLAVVEKARHDAEERAMQLAAAVKVAEAEKNMLRENVTDLRQQVGRVQLEKDRLQAQTAALASGVTQLAARSAELKQEFHENIPVNANLLYNDFLSNRVQVAVGGVVPALIGSGQRQKETLTVLVTDGTRTAALLQVNETPLVFSNPGFGLDRLAGHVTGRAGELPTGPVELAGADPRAVLLPVDAVAAAGSGCRVYPLSRNPFKFTEAVLVSRGGKYYGEVEFRLDPRTPGHVRMKTRILSRLFGEFSPSAGDLVLSKSGDILGVMVNNEYCVILKDLQPAAGCVFDEAMTRPLMSRRLEELRAWQDRLPGPLQ